MNCYVSILQHTPEDEAVEGSSHPHFAGTSLPECLTLAAIMAFGLGLRLHRLASANFWMDEVFQARAALQPSFSRLLEVTPLNKPPLFYALEWVIGRFTVSELALRLPACIAGVITIWAVWRLARILFADKTVALLVAGLLATSPLHIMYSQEARGYTSAMLFGLLGVVAMFVEFKRPKGQRKRYATLRLAIWPALSCWTLYFGLGLLALQVLLSAGLVLVAQDSRHAKKLRARGRRVIVGLCLATASLLPLIYRIPSQSIETNSFGFSRLTSDFFSGLVSWLSMSTETQPFPLATWAFLVAALIGLLVTLRRRRMESAFLLLWFVLVQGAQILLYARNGHWISARYHLSFLTPYLLWVAVGIVATLRFVRLRPGAICAVLVSFVLLTGFKAHKITNPADNNKTNLKRVARKLSTKATPNEAVVTSGYPGTVVYEFYREVYYPTAPPSIDLSQELPLVIRQIREKDGISLVGARTHVVDFEPFLRTLAPDMPNPFPRKRPAIAHIPAKGAENAVLTIGKHAERWKNIEARLPFSLEMRPEANNSCLLEGWSSSRKHGDAQVRYIRMQDATVYFNLPAARARALSLRAASLLADPFSTQTVTAHWDGNEIGTARITGNSLTRLTFAVPPEAGAAGGMHWLQLHCSESQKLEIPGESASEFSLMVQEIEIQ